MVHRISKLNTYTTDSANERPGIVKTILVNGEAVVHQFVVDQAIFICLTIMDRFDS